MRREITIELIQHDAGADTHRAGVDFQITHSTVMPRKIDDQSAADRPT
jgi:hypothetical protein